VALSFGMNRQFW